MKFKKLAILDKVVMTEQQKKDFEVLTERLVIFEDTPKSKEEILNRIGDADGIITSWTDLTEDIISACPNLKYIGMWSTGYSWVDVESAKKKGIVVTNVPKYATESVAELIFGQLISLLRKTRMADEKCRKGEFEQEGLQGEEIKGKTIGIIGLGKIGTKVAEIAKCFGMNVVYYDTIRKEIEEKRFGIKYLNLQELISGSDIITLHTNTGDEILGKEELEKIKDNSIIINFGVAGSVNEDALIEHLKSGRLKAIIDHFTEHKIKQGFIDAKENTILTPEIGFYTKQALERLTTTCIENAKNFLEGKVKNKV